MEMITHANVMPWLVDADYLLQLALQACRAVGLLAVFGLAYAGVRRALLNRRLDHLEHGDQRTLFTDFTPGGDLR